MNKFLRMSFAALALMLIAPVTVSADELINAQQTSLTNTTSYSEYQVPSTYVSGMLDTTGNTSTTITSTDSVTMSTTLNGAWISTYVVESPTVSVNVVSAIGALINLDQTQIHDLTNSFNYEFSNVTKSDIRGNITTLTEGTDYTIEGNKINFLNDLGIGQGYGYDVTITLNPSAPFSAYTFDYDGETYPDALTLVQTIDSATGDDIVANAINVNVDEMFTGLTVTVPENVEITNGNHVQIVLDLANNSNAPIQLSGITTSYYVFDNDTIIDNYNGPANGIINPGETVQLTIDADINDAYADYATYGEYYKAEMELTDGVPAWVGSASETNTYTTTFTYPSENDVTVDDEDEQSIAETGSLAVVSIAGLSTVAAVLVVLKRQVK